MYVFPHTITPQDIYRTIYGTDTTAHAFLEAAHYRYMNNWSEQFNDMDYLTYQWPSDWRIPEIRKYDRDAYIRDLPESLSYELVPDSEKASGGYYINTLAHAKSNIQLINAPADYVPLGKSKDGYLFVNANYSSPYHGIVVFVSNDYTYQAIVAHDAETFNEFWVESIVTAIDKGSVVDTCDAMRRGRDIWTLIPIDEDAMSSKTIEGYLLRLNILEELRIGDLHKHARIIVGDVGCYYSVGIIDRDRVERAGALFSKATGKCVIQGLGYLPDYPVLTWEKSFIHLMHIIRQEESVMTLIPSLVNLRKYGFSNEAIFGELDAYCGTNISDGFMKYTTLKQRQQRTIWAYCDRCGRGLSGTVGIWYTCKECKDYDVCSVCYPHWYGADCKKCETYIDLTTCHVVNGERITV